MQHNPTPDSKFVLLRNLHPCNCGCNMDFRPRFFTMFKPGDEPTKTYDGEVTYEVLGYAATVEEAQHKLYSAQP